MVGGDDDDEEEYYRRENSWDRSKGWWPRITEPKKEGLELLTSGEFGRIRHQVNSRNKDNNVAKLLLNRGTQVRPVSKEDIANDILPNTNGTAVADYGVNVYVGQYSSDSAFYYTCARDFRLHVYDTTAPLQPYVPSPRSRIHDDSRHETTMKVIKTIRAHPGRWTITDSHLSPDNQRMIYASISNTVYMTTTLDSSPVQTPICFADLRSRRGRVEYDDDDHFGIWSCKFSADGNEVIAGGSAYIFVYDLVANQRTVKIKAHDDDVNSCCWADTASGNVLISASDDSFVKVWDRRSLGTSRKPSGVLMGHTEGITYVSAKGDGRYVLSNGKDQVLRLWDLRKMHSNAEFEASATRSYGVPHFDYRDEVYPKPRYKAHPKDCSVMQYTGHEVLRTLIRCHFSPAATTGQQYIYSGSSDGQIHIWSLDGRVAQVLDRSQTLPMSFDATGPEFGRRSGTGRKVCVRDVSWHSEQPILMSAGWLGIRWGSREGSMIARHEWKGLSKSRGAIEDWVEKQRIERNERVRRRGMPGTFEVASDDETEDGVSENTPDMQPSAQDADLRTYGFPQGYFIIRSVATDRLLDVESDMVEDSTEVILWPATESSLVESMRRPECNNQVFFIDTYGQLCSRSSGHAVDVEDGERLVLRHRRPISHPFPNAYSHPLPRFVYNPDTKHITVLFGADPTYPSAMPDRAAAVATWRNKQYSLASIPLRKPRTIIDDASAILSSALTAPFSFFGSTNAASAARPDEVFDGEIDLREEEILEQDRSEEGEVDDSPERLRHVRVVSFAKEAAAGLGEKAKLRMQWEVLPLLTTKQRTEV
ncbi:WD40 repeat-like protein [Obba rivulosa]|uniref:WD40 repeat-like protein n=1 Tax=Obba rivulosa TaxID=1052685 RepID=A0A8E2DV37_9APHY|nr:WD40 repeat-like protein [Obba rivulosa]